MALKLGRAAEGCPRAAELLKAASAQEEAFRRKVCASTVWMLGSRASGLTGAAVTVHDGAMLCPLPRASWTTRPGVQLDCLLHNDGASWRMSMCAGQALCCSGVVVCCGPC